MFNDKHSMYVCMCWCKASTCLTSFVNVNSTWLYHAYHSVKCINNVVLAKLCINNLEYIIGQTLRMVKINNKTPTRYFTKVFTSFHIFFNQDNPCKAQTVCSLIKSELYLCSYVWFQVRTVESRTHWKS